MERTTMAGKTRTRPYLRPDWRAREEVTPVRTVQANPNAHKKVSRTRTERRKNPPLDMANVGLAALVALVLGGSRRVRPTIIEGLGNLASLARMAPAALARRAGLRLHDATRLAAAFELGKRYLVDAGAKRYRLDSTKSIAKWFRLNIGLLLHEEVWLLALDADCAIRGSRCIARGGLHGATFSTADVVRNALELGASSFVLVHNHPGNQLFPSPEDVRLTLLSYNAGELLRMPLADHIIVGPGKGYFSFLENGLMPEEPVDPKVWLRHDRKGA